MDNSHSRLTHGGSRLHRGISGVPNGIATLYTAVESCALAWLLRVSCPPLRRSSRALLCRRVACCVLLSLTLYSRAVSAQPTTAQLVKLIEVQQKQIDQLQARLDGQETFSRVTIDYLTTWSGLLMVQGWGFACGQADGGRLVIVVDGVQTGQATAQQFFRWPRYDVWNDANGALCRQVFAYVPTVNAGFQTLVDMTPYEPLEGKDRTHTVSVRIYDRYGRMRESEATTISYDAATKAYRIVPLRQE